MPASSCVNVEPDGEARVGSLEAPLLDMVSVILFYLKEKENVKNKKDFQVQ